MLPPTLVPASPATTTLPPPATAALLPKQRHRVTVNLSVNDARNFSYLLRDIHVSNGQRGEALAKVRVKLARQLKRYPATQQFATSN